MVILSLATCNPEVFDVAYKSGSHASSKDKDIRSAMATFLWPHFCAKKY